jgi:TetR/AcrR family transcriptional repressor of nem operon
MKDRLMDAAMDLMWQNSYGAASVDAICERAGAKKGSFYYFFKSKSELAAAALEADWNKKRAEMDSMFSPTVPPLERLDRYFDFVYDRLGTASEKMWLHPGVSVRERRQRNQHARSSRSRSDRSNHGPEAASSLCRRVRDAAARELSNTADPEAKAKALFACYQGTVAQARIQNDVDLLRQFKQVARDRFGSKAR